MATPEPVASRRTTAAQTVQRPPRHAADLGHRLDPADERAWALARLLEHYIHSAHGADRLLHPRRDPSPLPR